VTKDELLQLTLGELELNLGLGLSSFFFSYPIQPQRLLSQEASFRQLFTASVYRLCSVKIPSSRLHRRPLPPRRQHSSSRRHFTDVELEEILPNEELIKLRVPAVPAAVMTTRTVPAVSRPLPTFSGSKRVELSIYSPSLSVNIPISAISRLLLVDCR
jgi:hypothetical protein